MQGCHVQVPEGVPKHRLPRRGIDREAFPCRSTFRGVRATNSAGEDTLDWTIEEQRCRYTQLSSPQSFVGGKCDVLLKVFHPVADGKQKDDVVTAAAAHLRLEDHPDSDAAFWQHVEVDEALAAEIPRIPACPVAIVPMDHRPKFPPPLYNACVARLVTKKEPSTNVKAQLAMKAEWARLRAVPQPGSKKI